MTNQRSNSVSLTVVPLTFFANGKSIKTTALLDNACEVALIREDVAAKLNSKGLTRAISFGTYHGHDPDFLSRSVKFLC